MNRTEAANVIAYLNRAGLVGALEGQSAVWADALSDIRAEDAQEAARQMARNRTSAERWVTPGDIRALVRSIREDRAMRGAAHVGPPPSPLESDAYGHFIITSRRLLADGYSPEKARAAAYQQAVDLQKQVEA